MGATIIACAPKVAETPASPKLTQACDRICERRASCDPTFDAAACRTRCTTLESVRRLEAFRASASDPIFACLDANACDQDLGARAKQCAEDVAAKQPVTPRVKALCAKLEPQFRDCNTTWKTPCTSELGLYPEQDLGVFDECVDRQCRGGLACFRNAEEQLLSKHH